jgi:hypothetical protein
MSRREFFGIPSSAVVIFPLAAAEHPGSMPVVDYLSNGLFTTNHI